MAPCCLVEADRRFRGTYCLHYDRPDVGGSTHLLNAGLLLRGNMALYSRKLSSSFLQPWEP